MLGVSPFPKNIFPNIVDGQHGVLAIGFDNIIADFFKINRGVILFIAINQP